ncbi:MAG: hypothetical protein QM765_45945 [Myxococcales bacterium]
MPIPFDQILLRYLRQMPSFTEPAAGTPLSVFVATTTWDEERVLGWYRCAPPFDRDLVVFSNEALYTVGAENVRVAWGEVVRCELERPWSKAGVRVETTTGKHVVASGPLPGAAGVAGSSDIFNLMAVIQRARACYGAEKTRAK